MTSPLGLFVLGVDTLGGGLLGEEPSPGNVRPSAASLAITGSVPVVSAYPGPGPEPGPEPGSLSKPSLSVRVDWDADGSFSTTGDDISADVERMTYNLGACRDFRGGTQASSAMLTLLNENGKYSRENTSGPLYGKLRPNRPIWVTATYASVAYGVFAGYVERLVCDPGARRAYLYCEGMDQAFGTAPPAISPSRTRSFSAYRVAILDALRVPAGGRSFEAEYDSVPFSGGRKVRAIDLLEAINLATGSRHYIGAGATEASWYAYTAVNRHHKLDAAVDETIDDALDMDAYELDLATVGNQQSVVATPTVFPGEATVWTCPIVPVSLQAGHSQDIWASFSGFVLDAGFVETHTGTLTVAATYFGDSAKFTLTATTDATDATLTDLHVTGNMGVAAPGISVSAEDATSVLQTNYGPQAMPEIDTPLLGSSALAQGLADHLVWRFKDPHPRPVVRRFNKFPSMIARRLFDVVGLTYPRQSLAARRFEVVGLTGEIEPGADWTVSYQLQEAPSQTALQFFKLGGSAAEGVGGTGVLAR